MLHLKKHIQVIVVLNRHMPWICLLPPYWQPLNLPTTSILTTPQFADYLHIDNGRAFSDFCPLILSCVSTVTLTTKPFYSVKLRISEEVFAFRSNTKLIPGYALNQSPCIPSEEPVGWQKTPHHFFPDLSDSFV